MNEKLKWYEFVEYDEPIIKTYKELDTWDVINTAYGCPSNKGTYAVYKKRVTGTFEGDIGTEIWTYGVHTGVKYCPVCPQYSNVVEIVLTDKGYFTRKTIMSNSLHRFYNTIDEQLASDKYHVVGKLVETETEVE